jgi:DNA-binding transcriptional regulator/RsmH inhibitor MraZ
MNDVKYKHVFYGEFDARITKKSNIDLPDNYLKILKQISHRELNNYPMIIAPLPECVSMIPLVYFKDVEISEWINEISWTDELEKLVTNNLIYPCSPLYKSNKVSSKLQEAVGIYSKEIKHSQAALKNISGKEFERLLNDILLSLNVSVQLNVHILGAEIDLLLLSFNEKGKPEFTIVECKHKIQSHNPVEISQVMRLFGLTEALRRRSYPVKHSLMVSTTGFTRNAKQFAKIYKLDLISYQGLIEWINAHNLVSKPLHLPIFKLLNVHHDGGFTLPTPFVPYIKPKKEWIKILGSHNSIELWNPFAWEREKKLYQEQVWEIISSIERDIETKTITI